MCVVQISYPRESLPKCEITSQQHDKGYEIAFGYRISWNPNKDSLYEIITLSEYLIRNHYTIIILS